MASIRQKIWRSYVIITCAVGVLIGGINLLYSWQVTKEKEQQQLLAQAGHYALLLNNSFQELEFYAANLKLIVEQCFDLESVHGDIGEMQVCKMQIESMVLRMCKEFLPLSSWVVFHPDIAPGSHVVSFYRKEDSYIKDEEYSPRDFERSDPEIQWWYNALQYEYYWTGPFYWTDWDIEVITFGRKVEMDGVPVAVVGSELDFEDFRREMMEVVIFKTGYLYLMDDSLNFIVHPKYEGENIKDFLNPEDFNAFLQSLSGNGPNVLDYSWEGERRVSGFVKLSNGWVLGTAIPYNEFVADFRSLRNISFLIVLIVLIIAWISAYFIGRSLTSPIAALVKLFRQGEKGDFSQRYSMLRKDEIGELGAYFNHFMVNMEQMVVTINQAYQQIEVIKLKAEESDRLKTEFLKNLSHEIRTPLNAIVGFSRILAERCCHKEIYGKYIEYIEKNSETLIQFIEGLLDFAMLEVKETMLKEQKFEIDDLFQELKEEYVTMKEGVAFVLDLPVKCVDCQIVADRGRMKQVLQLLINNAFKFTENGTVTCSVEREEARWIFSVSDTGIGISEELGKVIFEKFRKGDEELGSVYRGIGMGLSLAKALVDLMNGHIWFESTINKGSTFFIAFDSQSVSMEKDKILRTINYV